MLYMARRQQNYEQFSNLAFNAFNSRQWSNVISYVGAALNTGYYCGSLYYVRGYAYEQLGNLKAAKKDYKVGKKYNCVEAAQALDALKAKRKAKR